ncbi:MAG: tRNA glutamyl-Q(34) synthetase GluQRS [Hyphomicrobiaceae bacterium]|nr:tRNA glutamyl-Q(34) synthetase GluQRS [Hyphomicrobiaceae bacterium]
MDLPEDRANVPPAERAGAGGRPVLRFAPSPNGELHLGHALSVLLTWEMAARLRGEALLRIEDIDTARTRPEHVAGILADLAWLGLAWPEPVVRQSQRFAAYRAAADRLAAMGVLYPCFATRSEIEAAADPAARDPDGAPVYPGLWRGRRGAEAAARTARGEPFALRLDMERALTLARQKLGGGALAFTELDAGGQGRRVVCEPARWGDAVLVRKDTPTSYHLAVVVDDAWQGVSHVTRGADLFAATDLHRLLQVLLELPEPVYAHHRLVTDGAGRKLAKSARDTSLRSLREQGASPADIRRMVGWGGPD